MTEAEAIERLMTEAEAIERLQILDAEIKEIRRTQKWGQPDEVLSKWDMPDDDEMLVVADGYGNADVLIIEGNYPIDYMRKDSLELPQDEAEELANFLHEEWVGDDDMKAAYRAMQEKKAEEAEAETAETGKAETCG